MSSLVVRADRQGWGKSLRLAAHDIAARNKAAFTPCLSSNRATLVSVSLLETAGNAGSGTYGGQCIWRAIQLEPLCQMIASINRPRPSP